MWITKFTQKIEYFAVKTKLIYNIGKKYYRDMIKNEISLANITSNDRILCIGGGLCPFSAIMLHQATGALVTVIDNNSSCISKARQVIERLGIGECVRVLHRDGGDTELSLSEYTIVHFAMQVAPLEYVLSQVERRAAAGTKLLVRRPKNCMKHLYSRITLSCPRYITHKKARSVGSTMLYIKDGA